VEEVEGGRAVTAHIWNLGSQSVPIGFFVKKVHQGVNDSDVPIDYIKTIPTNG
jgi:hypothetical protein